MTSLDPPQIKFPPGQLVMTPRASTAFVRARQTAIPYLLRHIQGDWGELDVHDVQKNENSLQHGLRLLSKYTLVDRTVIWIITEADRSVTTILLPEEY